MSDYRLFSFGGGVQSVAVLVLAALRRIEYDAFVFANVGDDSEHPDTLQYVRDYAVPFAEEFGLNLITVQKHRKLKGGGSVKTTLLTELHRAQKSIIIPMRMASGAPGNRNCTTDFKIRVIDQFVRALDPRPERVTVGLGISTDEYERARDTEWHDRESQSEKNPHKLGFWKRREYPLLEHRLNRAACESLIASVGLPIPPKSACFFCPFHSRGTWIEMKRKRPDLFAKAVEIERACNVKRLDVARDGAFLHISLKPLDQAVPDQLPLFADEPEEHCADAGYCMV